MSQKQNWTRNTFEQRKQRYKDLPIIEVAERLGVDLKKTGQSYISSEHDSLVFRPNKNDFYWNSKNVGGDTIRFVETYLDYSFKQAMQWFDEQDFSDEIVMARPKIDKPEFQYKLKDYPLKEGKIFLKNVRKLSDETIEYFEDKGVLVQTNRYYKEDGFNESVLAFKSFDGNGRLVGATLQGIKPYPERPTHFKGYLKEIIYASDGEHGVRVQTSKHPKKFVFCESSIDLMSYYEIYKNDLQDAVLVSMNGLKVSTIYSAFKDTFGKDSSLDAPTYFNDLTSRINYELAKEKGFEIILAVDNDEGGNKFIQNVQIENIPVVVHQPVLPSNEKKRDWNEVIQKGEQNKQKAPVLLNEWKLKQLAKEISSTIIQNKSILRNQSNVELRLRNFQLGINNETQIFQIKQGKEVLFRIPLALQENHLVYDEVKSSVLMISETFPKEFIPAFVAEINKVDYHPLLLQQKQQQKNATIEKVAIIDKEKIIHQVQKLPNQLQKPKEFIQMMNLMARFPELSANNLALLYVQKPNASFVATKDEWESKHHVVNSAVSPVMLLNKVSNDQNVPQKIKLVYDMGDIVHTPNSTKNLNEVQMNEHTFKNIFLSIIHSTNYKVVYESLPIEQSGYIHNDSQRIIFNKNLLQNAKDKYSYIVQEIMQLVQETKIPSDVKEAFKENKAAINVFNRAIVYATMVHFGIDNTLEKELNFDKCTPQQIQIFMKNFSEIQRQTQERIRVIEQSLNLQREQTRNQNPIRTEIQRVRGIMANEKKQEPPSIQQQINYHKGRVYNESRN